MSYIQSINFELEEMPRTCFDCPFSKKSYCWATCPITLKTTEDGECLPKNCPFKKKNQNKIYHFNEKIYKE